MSEYVNLKSAPKLGGGHIRKGWQKRMGVSDTLKTNEMWRTIGHDPYAGEGEKEDREKKEAKKIGKWKV
jgi:hypothetical protein